MSKKRKGMRVELEIESIGAEGVGIAKPNGKAHFVKYAVPGDTIIAEITREKSKFAEARLIEVLKPGESRVEPPCGYFGVCGGCSWQSLAYAAQLEWKRKQVGDSFERIAKIPVAELLPAMGSALEYGYRNKMEFSFSAQRWLTSDEIASGEDFNRDFALGLHVPGRFDKVLDLNYCLLHPERANEILRSVRQKALELGLSAYHSREHTGFLRNLLIRSGSNYSEFMVALIAQSPRLPEEDEFIEWLAGGFAEQFPEAKSIFLATNDTVSPVAVGYLKLLKGEEIIIEKILGVDFQISPFSFFQTNSRQLDPFVGKIIEFSDLAPGETLWDLYCGAGSITLPASRAVSRAFGVELSESSIADARLNAQRNSITNAEFHRADLHDKQMPELLRSLPAPDVVIIDPPRAGMHENLTRTLLEAAPPRITYVSCNPATQARDCAILAEKYDVGKVMPVDMFPQTHHVESIAQLFRK